MLIHHDAKNNNLNNIKLHLKSGTYHINDINEFNETALHIAISHDYTKLALFLINYKNINLNIKNNYGDTPLHIAVFKQNLTIVERLFNVNGNIQNNDGKTPLIIAIENGETDDEVNECAAILIKSLKGVNTSNSNGQTPLMIAIENGNRSTVKMLINYHANADFQDTDGNTALHYAVNYGSRVIVGMVTTDYNLHCLNNDLVTPLFYAVDNGDQGLTKDLLDIGANPLSGHEKKMIYDKNNLIWYGRLNIFYD